MKTFEKFILEMKEKKAKKGFMDIYTKRYDPDKLGYGDPDKWKDAFNERMGRERAEEIMGDKDPYVILGVSPTADKYEIKDAWRKLVMKFHPDRNPDIDTTAIFQDIQAAYELLRDD